MCPILECFIITVLKLSKASFFAVQLRFRFGFDAFHTKLLMIKTLGKKKPLLVRAIAPFSQFFPKFIMVYFPFSQRIWRFDTAFFVKKPHGMLSDYARCVSERPEWLLKVFRKYADGPNASPNSMIGAQILKLKIWIPKLFWSRIGPDTRRMFSTCFANHYSRRRMCVSYWLINSRRWLVKISFIARFGENRCKISAIMAASSKWSTDVSDISPKKKPTKCIHYQEHRDVYGEELHKKLQFFWHTM